MSKDKSTSSPTVRAVAYYRMSTDKQEDSIHQQQNVMRPKTVTAGIETVKEFKDEAISGGKMKKRDDFNAMLAFCQEQQRQGKPIEAIVCWDTARFSRADSIETGKYLSAFRDAGTSKLFTTEGWIDLNKEEDRVHFFVRQDTSNSKYLRSLGHAVTRGKLAYFEKGHWQGATTPYAFDRALVDDKGNVQKRLSSGEKAEKPGCHVALAPTEDQDKIETARWIYQHFATAETSLRNIAKQLNERGVQAPGSNNKRNPHTTHWTSITVKRILSSPVYVGDVRYGRESRGDYYHAINGQAVKADNGHATYHPDAPIKQNTHEGIIDRALWARVQEKLRIRKGKKWRPRHNGYVLSGLIYCGHCGHKMYGEQRAYDGKRKKHKLRYYVCSGEAVRPGSCKLFRIREDRLLPWFKNKLAELYQDAERRKSVGECVSSKVDATADPEKTNRLRKNLSVLNAKVQLGAANLIKADAENFDLLQTALNDLRRLRDSVQAELTAHERGQSVPNEEMAKVKVRAKERFTGLGEALKAAKDEKLRPILADWISRIELFFGERDTRSQKRYFFAKGCVTFKRIVDATTTHSDGCEVSGNGTGACSFAT